MSINAIKKDKITKQIIRTFYDDKIEIDKKFEDDVTVDLFFTEYNLVIDCNYRRKNYLKDKYENEDERSYYNEFEDEQLKREEILKVKYDCKIIEIIINQENIDIFEILSKIYDHIKNYYRSCHYINKTYNFIH